ncbi:uncharacterized protein BKA78DRAFT_365852 [Phyllosticta capitalensis]|uniref:uncharacterized protein n=1 Tax=Phyllosticta capitalensis TaxID=121624 RepID=UPI003131EB46
MSRPLQPHQRRKEPGEQGQDRNPRDSATRIGEIRAIHRLRHATSSHNRRRTMVTSSTRGPVFPTKAPKGQYKSTLTTHFRFCVRLPLPVRLVPRNASTLLRCCLRRRSSSAQHGSRRIQDATTPPHSQKRDRITRAAFSRSLPVAAPPAPQQKVLLLLALRPRSQRQRPRHLRHRLPPRPLKPLRVWATGTHNDLSRPLHAHAVARHRRIAHLPRPPLLQRHRRDAHRTRRSRTHHAAGARRRGRAARYAWRDAPHHGDAGGCVV